jgi:hypothetical protein
MDERLPHRIFVGHGGDCRHLGEHADACNLALPGIADIGGVVIERRQRPNHSEHDRHRMRITAEARIEPRHLLVHHGVVHDADAELLVLLSRGKLAVEKKIAGLDEVAPPGELIYGVAAIKQDALIAIDKVIFDSQLAVDMKPGS